MLFYWKYTKIV